MNLAVFERMEVLAIRLIIFCGGVWEQHIRNFLAKVCKDLRVAETRLPYVRLLVEAKSKP